MADEWPDTELVVIDGDMEVDRDESSGRDRSTLLCYQMFPVQVVKRVAFSRASNSIECPGARVLERSDISARLGPADNGAIDAGALEALASAINHGKLELLLWEDGWEIPGLGDWLQVRNEQRQAREAGKAAAERKKAAQEWRDSDDFINPYNFVPLPAVDGPERLAPRTHEVLGDRLLSGRIEFSLFALTPLAISGPGDPQKQSDPVTPHHIDGSVVIPGSSLAGVVRTFHEALTGSCLRILDTGFRPVHREPAVSHLHGGWRMAIVEEDNAAVRLCEPFCCDGKDYAAIWVEADWLGTAVGSLESGDPYEFTAEAGDVHVPNRRERPELRRGAITPMRRRSGGAKLGESDALQPGDWITMVTRRLKDRVVLAGEHPYHIPFAKVSDQVVQLAPDVLADYRAVAAGSEDQVTLDKKKRPHLRIEGTSGTIGNRQVKDVNLPKGTVVWVDTNDSRDAVTVTRISRASIWRRRGEGPVSKRVDGYAPCTNPEELCPSCRMFGMVHEREEKASRTGIHDAYRGRVRFGWATFDGKPSITLTGAQQIGPLGQPRPSSGQFYLETDPVWNGQRAKTQTDRPLRDWGSAVDGGETRRIRGRKRYWAVATDRARDVGAHNDNDELKVWQRLVKKDSHARGWVTFEGLTRAELGSLLASIDPNLMAGVKQATAVQQPRVWGEADEHPFVHQIGKAKAKGLGAVKVQIDDLRTWSVDRYLAGVPGRGPADSEPDLAPDEDTIRDMVSEFADSVSSDITGTWPALLAMAQFARFPAEMVKYPPDDHANQDFKFDFWRNSSGAYLRDHGDKKEKNRGRGLVILPDAASPDPRISRPWLETDR